MRRERMERKKKKEREKGRQTHIFANGAGEMTGLSESESDGEFDVWYLRGYLKTSSCLFPYLAKLATFLLLK